MIEVSDGLRACSERAVASVFRVRRLDGQLAYGHALPHVQLDDLPEPATTEQTTQPAGDHDERRAPDLLEGSAIQVIVVRVRHEHGVDLAMSGRVDLHTSP